MNRDHFKSLLLSHIPPLPAHKASAKQKQARKWINMGFPEQKYEPYPSLCSWYVHERAHPIAEADATPNDQRPTLSVSLCLLFPSHEELRYGGYNCPKCLSKFCELPTECKVCNLTLVSSPHLARSYHHLFPVTLFEEIGQDEQGSVVKSAGRVRLQTRNGMQAVF